MRKLLVWLLVLMLTSPAMAEMPCALARKTGEDYVCHVVHDDPAGDDFFDGTVIIGDSITMSLGDYDVIPTMEVESYIGISPEHAHKSRIMKHKGQYVTLLELAASYKPDRLLIMLGSNGLSYKLAREVLEQSHGLVDAALKALPDAEIYLLSVTPVRPGVREKTWGLNMDNIRDFNAGLKAMAEAHGVYFIDLCSPLMAEDGSGIRKDYCTPDGLHLSRDGAEAVADAIRRQTGR